MKRLTSADEPTADGNLHCQDKQRLAYRGSGSPLTFPLLGRRGDTPLTMGIEGNPHASAKVGQLRNQSRISW
ncbi:MAG TPA: hypothetical protein VH599_02830 [Ktedonobacterales bacterium]